MHTVSILSVGALVASPALATTHFFYTGYFDQEYVSGIEFDDETNNLTLVDNYPVTSGSSRWIATDANRQNLYIAGDGLYQSYAIDSTDNTLTATGSNITDTTSCSQGVSLAVSPATLFGVAYDSACNGVAISIDTSSGALVQKVANLTYDASAGVHGLAMSPDSKFVYSADDMGSRVWAHAYDGAATAAAANDSGAVAAVQEVATAGARHLVVHPGGKWLYVIRESANEIGVFSRDVTTGVLTDANETYSLIPDGFSNSSSYWSSDVTTSNSSSTSPKYLLAYARSRTSGINGYVNGFALDEETGAITGRIFVEEANGYGGTTNAVTPSLFSEEYFTVTDEGENFVEVWQIADDGTSASEVAHLDLESAPVNVAWYS